MIELKEWIKDGIDIRKIKDGYQVFTIPTQHFEIKELDELTPDKFKEMVERQNHFAKWPFWCRQIIFHQSSFSSVEIAHQRSEWLERQRDAYHHVCRNVRSAFWW